MSSGRAGLQQEEEASNQTPSPTPQEVQLEGSSPWHSWQVEWHGWHWFLNSNLPEGQFKTQRPSSKILEETRLLEFVRVTLWSGVKY